MLKINKRQLDLLATIFGAVAGIASVLVSTGYLDAKLGGAIGGISTVLLGAIANKPATARPDTEDVENEERQQ